MDHDEIKRRFFESKAGVLDEPDLRPAGRTEVRGRPYLLYDCPCGGTDHVAMRAFEDDGFSRFPADILNCFVNRLQWLIRPVDVAGTIRREEEKYLDLIRRAPAIVAKVVARRGWSEETLAFLEDTHGIDRELAESVRPKGE